MSDDVRTPEPFSEPPPPATSPRRRWPRVLFLAATLLLALALLAATLALGTGYGYRPLDGGQIASHLAASAQAPLDPKALAGYEKGLAKIRPKEPFIVIDRVRNRLRLVEGGKVTLDAVISAGAGSVLEDPTGKRKWVFDTPVGRFKVKGRREHPLWTAPDWDYIESGEPFPKRYSDRVQEGMLGEYALDLDEPGYMIHGTLYTRLLGRNVSHGCIRVGRDDLRIVWKKCPIGTAVFIY